MTNIKTAKDLQDFLGYPTKKLSMKGFKKLIKGRTCTVRIGFPTGTLAPRSSYPSTNIACLLIGLGHGRTVKTKLTCGTTYERYLTVKSCKKITGRVSVDFQEAYVKKAQELGYSPYQERLEWDWETTAELESLDKEALYSFLYKLACCSK
ncbi:MAG: hypothetical protein F6K53_20375 [Moorea sp. SIO4A1]|uniref:hypothetical protein n=1 Tax=Moorena sp. SIO4A1 TaxID=2607835 RepID=UPI0014188972|nr:hypothetical protein [Moorena sp. SIO4A1]NEO43730.1 hypothetical protein [Moorena sp. SIO4A3]NEQ59629.1 hypothetical protein [Moorena sp. SIO4A1]